MFKRYVPWGILVAMTSMVAADTIIVQTDLNNMIKSATTALSIIGSFAVMVSVILLTRSHAGKIRKNKLAVESWTLLGCMWVMIIYGLYRFIFAGVRPIAEPTIQYIFNAIVAPGDSTVYALLYFVIASACYRAFRAKNMRSLILLIVGIVFIIGRAPIGQLLYVGMPDLANWILNVPGAAMVKALLLAEVISSFALNIRVLLGQERGWMGRGD